MTPIPNKANLFRFPTLRRPTPLIYAICCHELEIVQQLVGIGADITQAVYSWHPVHYAAAVRDLAILNYILSVAPKEIEAETDHKATPMHFAIAANNLEMVVLLLSKGADVLHTNSNGDSPLHMSMILINPQITKILLAFGAQADATNNKGQVPADIAKERNIAPMLAFLEELEQNPKLIPSRQQVLADFPVNIGKSLDTDEPAADTETLVERLDAMSQRMNNVEEMLQIQQNKQ